jgi:hypothetical protein
MARRRANPLPRKAFVCEFEFIARPGSTRNMIRVVGYIEFYN